MAVLVQATSVSGADLSNTTGAAVLPPSTVSTEQATSADDPPTNPDVNTPPARASFLKSGETLVFRLSWGIFSNAGQLRIETTEETSPEHGRRLRVRVHTKSKGLISAVFPVDSSADSWIDPVTGRPLLVERTGKEGDKDVHSTTVYNYDTHRVVHTDHNREKRSGEADLPEEPAYDTFVVMMLARTWNLAVGESRTVVSSFEDDIYEIKATAVDEEKMKTPFGKQDVVEIELEQLGELKGFFRKGGEARFFISRGENPQIVRIELRAKAGTFAMTLESVEEATPATPEEQ